MSEKPDLRAGELSPQDQEAARLVREKYAKVITAAVELGDPEWVDAFDSHEWVEYVTELGDAIRALDWLLTKGAPLPEPWVPGIPPTSNPL
ncbi:hypothetical protein ACFRI7_37875 [Streptomyces sp. NPDC056716]|uniref:hypothetical protein n=1 Tax=unclassified Streptomyces TaxID=2593676 RepID=UPI0036BF4933